MKKNLVVFLILLFLAPQYTYSQRKLTKGGKVNLPSNNGLLGGRDSTNTRETKVTLSGKTKFTDYRIFSFLKDTVYVDTTLNIKKEYKFNFLRKDNFELLAFHNQGQTFNSLGYSFNNISSFPDIGRSAKQFFYIKKKEVKYYQVPTPTTEILYRTGLQQGQVLDALFTLNFSKRFNASIAYKGIRSLGQYRRSLASQGNFRATFHYETKENQYTIRGHIASQDLLNYENGGLTATSLEAFITDDPNFSERGRLDVNLSNTETLFEGERYYFEHDFKLLSSKNKDSVENKKLSNLKIGHILSAENKLFTLTESAPNTFFGNASTTTAVNETVKSRLTSNQFFLEFNSKYVLGKFRVKSMLSSFYYGYDTIYNITNTPSRISLKGNVLGFGADWQAKIKNFSLIADAQLTPGNSKLGGSHLAGKAIYRKDSLFTLKASLLVNSKSPNFNFLLHQSTYDDYNWDNNFNDVNTQDIGFAIESKWINASANFTNIENYTYFDENNAPQQSSENITYLKIKASNEFTYGKFALNNTIMYQNVSAGSAVFRVPDFVTRNTLYYSDYWFKGKPLQVQIGATFKYFTSYKANAFNPLLAEFTIQNTTEIGYPTVDLFFNAQVRRTRIYFKIDNVTSNFGEKNYFSAPNYPYRDFVIRFGLVWNWFI
ncbi:MAG: putative porin [Flavobacteriaceae bacterium]